MCIRDRNSLRADDRMQDVGTSSEGAVRAAFVDAFESANVKLHLSRELRGTHSSGGTTMIVVVATPDTLWVAWAGDSRAVMGSHSSRSGPKVVTLSRDHTCAIPSEWHRVDKAGGRRMVNEQTGAARVVVPGSRPEEFHTLAMSRSLGDKPFHAAGVVATPEVDRFDWTPSGLLVVCSDGVWEHIDDAEAVEIACRGGGRDASKACKALMERAVEKWASNNPCYRDDITALVVDLASLAQLFDNHATLQAHPMPASKHKRQH
eukprot:TRINITY_DN3644_c0_g1_i3.p1 TRINITY_DN3644_c0_g1~~TRINITY_DN3644_c0_g1_i3.p1  ORF type:complete len:262 (-),score=54.53 TRINITY_DN3644_c0_g1_i3:219-1004(-)